MTPERKEIYDLAIREIRAVTAGEMDAIANMANASAILYERLPFSWIGFYRLVHDELVLGPFQGRVACVRIGPGRGVCGVAWERGETLSVSDVHAFPGHIACDPLSRSEVVVPLRAPDGRIWGVLDVDSREPNDFDGDDVEALEKIGRIIEDAAARDERFLAAALGG
ncbi:MAG: GAF domain-containing protein [Candidatus Eisenbacteria bacterium]|nr:GAF domain-containing protein [Candidatus Eisenbacteria bacterium]